MFKRPTSLKMVFGAGIAAALFASLLPGAQAQIPDTRIFLPTTPITPAGNLLFDPATNLLFGTTQGDGASSFGNVYSVNPHVGTSSLSTVYTFSGGSSDGGIPGGGVISDVSGNLFGTTTTGGANAYGDVFELAKTNTGYAYHDLYDFAASEVAAGELSLYGGHLYGVANTGGAGGAGGPGTVFEVLDPYASTASPSNGVTLYDFSTTSATGPGGGIGGGVAVTSNPGGGVTLFGTLQTGLNGSGNGGIFSLTVTNPDSPVGTVSINDVYDFTGQGNGDGTGPTGTPLFAYGNLYGSTYSGGVNGTGSIYQISNAAGLTPTEQTLYSFSASGAYDGSAPSNSLILGDALTLLGTTSQGGNGYGTAWSYFIPGGQFSTLLGFNGTTDGGVSYSGLTEIQPGIFAGVNTSGGSGNGVLFIITPEPGSYATMLIGALSLGGFAARRRRRQTK